MTLLPQQQCRIILWSLPEPCDVWTGNYQIKNGKEVGRTSQKRLLYLTHRFSYRNLKEKNDLAKIKEEDFESKVCSIVD